MSNSRLTRRAMLAAVPAAAGAFGVCSAIAAEAPPATKPSTQPSTQPTRTQIKIKELEQFYARTYGEPLNLPDRLPKEIAIISLSRIESADTTQRLLDIFKMKDRDPIVWWLAWEALHARTASMGQDQRQRWATGGLQAAVMPGGFPGTTVTPLLHALAEHHPTTYEDMPHKLAVRVLQENDLDERDEKEALNALRKLVAAWHEPSLIRIIANQASRPGLAPRVDHVLRNLPNPPPSDTDAKKVAGVWLAWLEKSGLKTAASTELKPYKGTSTVFPASERITDPDDKRWRGDLEIGKLTVTDFDLVWCIDSTGSMNAPNQTVAAETAHVIRICSLISRRARCGTIYARHEIDKAHTQKCCEAAGSRAGWYQVKGYALSTDVRQLVAKMAAERIPPPDSANEGNTHPGTPVLGALQAAIKGMEWSKDKQARRVIVMVGDSPLTPNSEKATEAFAAQCKREGFHLHALTIRRATTEWQNVFKAAGGQMVPFDKGGGAGGGGGGKGRRAMMGGGARSVFTQLAATVIRECVAKPYHDRVGPLVDRLAVYAIAMEGAENNAAGATGK